MWTERRLISHIRERSGGEFENEGEIVGEAAHERNGSAERSAHHLRGRTFLHDPGDMLAALPEERVDVLLPSHLGWQIDALEAQNHRRLTHRVRHSLFHWPLGAALMLFVLGQLAAAVQPPPRMGSARA